MLNSPIIEVIIGMIFIYSLLSIIVTQINTVVVNLLNTRSKHLKAGIQDLLTDPVIQAKFMAHPLIRLIEPKLQPEDRISAQAAERVTASEPGRLTWIAPELFSQALLDILASNSERDIFTPLLETAEQVLFGAEKMRIREMILRYRSSGIGLTELRNAVNGIADPMSREAINRDLAYVEQMRAELDLNNESSKLIPLLDGIRNIQNPVLHKALETLLASAQSIEEAQDKIEFWFNTRMEQLSETYKKNIQYMSLLIGVLLAVLLNIDSLFVANTLWNDPALRDALVQAAQTQLESGQLQETISQSQEALQQAENNAEATPEPTVPVTGTAGNETGAPSAAEQVQDSIESLLALRLPIGWEFTSLTSGCEPNVLGNPCDDVRNLWNLGPANNAAWFGILIRKLIGWAITVIAISQGAPFWFDLLNRIARGRSS
jgi:hypothetical protein